MTKTQHKAEQYVRESIPELMELSFGCVIFNPYDYPLIYIGFNNGQHALSLTKDGEKSLLFVDSIKPVEIGGHPVQLQHWLSVLGGVEPIETTVVTSELDLAVQFESACITFNLMTGQPATEEDYIAFCNIVGI